MKKIGRFTRELASITKCLGFPFAIRYLFMAFKVLPEVLYTSSLGPVDKLITGLCKVKKWGFFFIFEPDSFPAIRELILNNCYRFDPSKNYDTIIDLGANRGVFTVISARVARQVISIECNETKMPEKFFRTMKINEVQNFIFINKFVSSIEQDNKISLNSIIKEYKLREISFLKMDIEGAEKDLFSNNLEWMKLTKHISMEIHPCFGVEVDKIIIVLKKYGFRYHLFDKEFKSINQLQEKDMGYICAQKK